MKKRMIAVLLTAAMVLTEALCMQMPVQASQDAKEESLFEQFELTNDVDVQNRAGVRLVDLSEQGIIDAQVSSEQELLDAIGVSQQEVIASEQEMEASIEALYAGDELSEEAGVSTNEAAETSVSANEAELEAEQAVYATLADAADYVKGQMVKRKALITVKVANSKDSSQKKIRDIVMQAFEYDENDAPDEGDYIYYHMSYMKWAQVGSNSSTITFRIGALYYTSASDETYVTQKVKEIINELNLTSDGLTDYQKVRLIYDYIMANVSYDDYHYTYNQNYEPMYTTYAALHDGKAVCQGYASLFYRLCQEVGISARVVTGNPTAPHAWNTVQVGDNYYNVDATWDDGTSPTHTYFLKNKEDFKGHTRDEKFEADSFTKAFPLSDSSYPFVTEMTALVDLPNITGALTTVEGQSVSLTAAGKPKILFFLNPGDTYSTDLFEEFNQCKNLAQENAEVVFIDIYPNYANVSEVTSKDFIDVLKLFAENSVNLTYCLQSDLGNVYRNAYAALAGGTQGNDTAVVVIDANDHVRYFAQGAACEKSLSGVIATVLSGDTQEITGVTVTQTKNNQMKLTWNAHAGAEKYVVYRKLNGGEYYCVGTTTSASYTNTISQTGIYEYMVYAVQGDVTLAQSQAVAATAVKMLPAKGKQYTVNGYKYKVLTSTNKSKTVSFTGITSKSAKTVTIPATVKLDGISYKVTQIAPSALKGKTKIKTLVIGKNVTSIGSKAFSGCKKLVNIVVKSKSLKKVGSKALKGIGSKAYVYVPSSKLKAYRKLFKNKGQKSTVSIKK